MAERKYSPEVILYHAKMGILWQEFTDSYNHWKTQEIRKMANREGYVLFMGGSIHVDNLYCCAKCDKK